MSIVGKANLSAVSDDGSCRGRPLLLQPAWRETSRWCVLGELPAAHGAQHPLFLFAVLLPWEEGAVLVWPVLTLSAVLERRCRPSTAPRGLGLTVVSEGTKVPVFDSQNRVFGCGSPRQLFALDGSRRILRRRAFIVLIVTIFVLRVRYDESDSTMVEPPSVCGVQTVTPGSKAPRVTALVTSPAIFLRAAEHQPVGRAGWSLTEWRLTR